jgi:hypothetical protein
LDDPAMATYTWTASGHRGDWASASSWNPNSGPPGAPDTAFFGTLGHTRYRVNVSATDAVTVSQVTIDTTAARGYPMFSISGSLTIGTLLYATAVNGPTTRITINAGGLLDITTSLADPALLESIFISGKGTGGIGSGGHLELGGLTVGAGSNLQFVFQNNNAAGRLSNTGVLEFTSGYVPGAITTQTVVNVAHGDAFIIDGADFTGDTVTLNQGTHTLTVTKAGAPPVFTMDNVFLQSGAANGFIAIGDVILAVCYARGTMIGTPEGEAPVEKLRAGRQVITLVDGERVSRTVKWLGHRRVAIAGHRHPETVAPVRIVRGAFADGMPHRDLLVSPDHAIFVDGKLICARQLVNGATIRQELDWKAVDYYHVELDRHAILLAEGLPAESYIDTGNSGFFTNSDAPFVLHPDLTDQSGYPTREAASCAPLVWDETNVRPVWERLAERSTRIGRLVPARTTTTDPALRLLAKGRSVKPIYADPRLAIFALPRGAPEVRLVSRAQAPTLARPWLEDRRRLGVRVARIVLRGVQEVQEVPPDHPGLGHGWWAIEQDGHTTSRWTDGDAALPLPAMQGNLMLEVHLAGTMSYLVQPEPATECERFVA